MASQAPLYLDKAPRQLEDSLASNLSNKPTNNIKRIHLHHFQLLTIALQCIPSEGLIKAWFRAWQRYLIITRNAYYYYLKWPIKVY